MKSLKNRPKKISKGYVMQVSGKNRYSVIEHTALTLFLIFSMGLFAGYGLKAFLDYADELASEYDC